MNMLEQNQDLLEQSLIVIGDAGTGKTRFKKEWIVAHSKVNKPKHIGIVCLAEDKVEYEALTKQLSADHAITLFVVEDEEIKDSPNKSLAAFIEKQDVVVIDEGGLIVGNGEELHHVLDLCENKLLLVSYQSLDQLSKSQIYLESVLIRFDRLVFFRIHKSFSADFILGEERARAASELYERGSRLIVDLRVGTV